MEEKPSIQVAAAILFQEGHFLIAKRKAGVHLEGLWEFPGGKREPGETLEQCVCREVLEELGIEILQPTLFCVLQHEYPDKCVELHFFCCSVFKGELQPLDCEYYRWVIPHELPLFDFPAADLAIIPRLTQAFDPLRVQ